MAGYAQALMDKVWSNLDYLCHFTQAVDGHGKLHSMSEVHAHLKDLFSATHFILVGREYRPKICRVLEDRERKESDAESN